ncbi:MAG: toll/interleukin-1 receptor domain-containing protein [Rhodospirillales bacterium]
MSETSPVRVFISYSHADNALRRKLERHLVALKNQHLIEVWSDRQIDAGIEWEHSIRESLEAAEIILLLISADFLASDFCQQTELKCAVERHAAGQARVIPVFLKPCHWEGAVFGRLQGVPEDARPVTTFSDPDRAFVMIAEAVRKAASDLRLPRRRWTRDRPPEPAPLNPSPEDAAAKGVPPGGAPHVELGRTPGMSESVANPEWEPPPIPPPSHLETFTSFLNNTAKRTASGLITRSKTLPALITPLRRRPRLIIASAVLIVLLLIGFFILPERSQIKEAEPNNIFSSATAMDVGKSAIANISDSKDVDFYKIRIPDDFTGSVDILLNNLSGSDGFAPSIKIYNESFDNIKDIYSMYRGSYLAYVLPINKGVRAFYISVGNHRYATSGGSDAGRYELSVLPHS